MSRIILLVFLALLCTSCGEKENAHPIPNGLPGSWDWIATGGGFTGDLHITPNSDGFGPVQLILTADMQYVVRTGDDLAASGTYTVPLKRSIYSHEQEPFISYSGNMPATGSVFTGIVQFEGPDTLHIADNYYDGLGSTYVRNRRE